VSSEVADDTRAPLRAELAALTTESHDATAADLDRHATAELVRRMNEQDQLVAHAVARAVPAITAAIDAIVNRLRDGGRLIYIGAGTSGRLGVLDASECPPTFGTDPSLVLGLIAGGDHAIRSAVEGAEDDEDGGRDDLRRVQLTPGDVVVGISASGRTPYVLGALQYANATGALTVGIACNAGSALGALTEHPLEIVVGSEFLTGSTRLKAGTAQKMVLNMLTTVTMIRLGKTYGNIMVDLRATNEKLRARAERAIMAVTGVPAGTAAAALAQSDGSAKEAMLALLAGIPAKSAGRRLEQHNGFLRAALEAAPGPGEEHHSP
jgi:N-acetylmuramic acid 6-phosphate etherase